MVELLGLTALTVRVSPGAMKISNGVRSRNVPPLPFLIGFPLYFSGLTAPVGPFVEDRVFNWCGAVIVP